MARHPLSPYRPGMLGERSFYGDPFLSLHREMNRLFDDALRGPAGIPGQGGSAQTQALTPHVDVSETEREVRIVAELPGVTDKDVEVTLNDDVLTIRGEKKFERNEEKENYHVVERSFGSFQRSLRLPFVIEADQIKASFDHGVLTITVPKGREQERTRRIQIGTGGTQGSNTGAATGGQSGAAGSQSKPDTMQGVGRSAAPSGSAQSSPARS